MRAAINESMSAFVSSSLGWLPLRRGHFYYKATTKGLNREVGVAHREGPAAGLCSDPDGTE